MPHLPRLTPLALSLALLLGSAPLLAAEQSTPAIEEMARNDIVLVVPESLKKSKEAVYEKQDKVITFRDFFDQEIRASRPALLLAG